MRRAPRKPHAVTFHRVGFAHTDARTAQAFRQVGSKQILKDLTLKVAFFYIAVVRYRTVKWYEPIAI